MISNTEQGGNHPASLSLIRSDRKRAEVLEILHAANPTHAERLWFAGFLKFAGYTCEEVCEIIHLTCEWIDYDPRTTGYQVATVFHQPHRSSSGPRTTRRERKPVLSPLQSYRISCARTSEMNRRITAELHRLGVPVYESPHSQGLPFRPETLLRAGL
jgi:hypothetical protein